MSEWIPGLAAKRAISELLDTFLRELVYQLGVDEIISSCEVIHMDPYAAATFPRYIKVRIHQYYQDVLYRGGMGFGVGDYVHVIHLREGDRYEVLSVGGVAGSTATDLEALSDYARGFIIRGGAADWEAYDANDDGQILVGDGADIASVPVTGDVSLTNAGVTKVLSIQDYDVQDHAPLDREVLIWSNANSRWEPDNVTDDDLVVDGYLALRPEINVDEIRKQTVPTQVQIGVFFGYSMPIYAADNEELFLRQVVPARWDEASDIIVHVLTAISQAEDVGDYFKFQMSWNNVADDSDIVPVATHDVTAEQIILAGRAAQYNVYELTFTVDYDIDGVGNEVQAHDLLAYRLRRVDATDPDVTGEIIVLCWHNHFQVDKVFGT